MDRYVKADILDTVEHADSMSETDKEEVIKQINESFDSLTEALLKIRESADQIKNDLDLILKYTK